MSDFFAAMMGNDAQQRFDSEISIGAEQSDQLLAKYNVPTGELTDEIVANFKSQVCEGGVAQLALYRELNKAWKQHSDKLIKIAEQKNLLRERGQLTQQRQNELKAEAAESWAKYQSATMVLSATTQNSVNLLGHSTQEEITLQNLKHGQALERETARYAGRWEKAQAKNQNWMANLRETIQRSLAGINQPSQLSQGQQQKVFGIFEGRKSKA